MDMLFWVVLLAALGGGAWLWWRRARPVTTADALNAQTQARLRELNGLFVAYLEDKEADLLRRMARGSSAGDRADDTPDLAHLEQD